MKKKLTIICGVLVVIIVSLGIGCLVINKDNNSSSGIGNSNSNSNQLKKLPLPEVTGGTRGELGIDKNINEQNIDDYLGRSDSVYRDMRMLEDPGNYESIGGDSMLSGYIKGFEIIPLPYIIPVSGLPESVGDTYQGQTLFSIDNNGKYVANYEESMSILEENFPKDKYIFLMCGAGGYAGMTKNLLVSLGWDETKIYNVGGYWYYDGKNNVEVKKIVDGKVVYDFDNVPYINIDFTKLHKLQTSTSNSNGNSNVTSNSNTASNSNVTSNTKSNSNVISNTNATSNSNGLPIRLDEKYYNNTSLKEFDAIDNDIQVIYDECLGIDSGKEKEAYSQCFARVENKMNEKAKMIDKLLDGKATFILRVSPGDTCFSPGASDINMSAVSFSKKNNIYIYHVSMGVYKYTKLYNKAKYAPAVVIVSKGEILVYTDPNKDEFLKIGQDDDLFEQWIKKYIVIK